MSPVASSWFGVSTSTNDRLMDPTWTKASSTGAGLSTVIMPAMRA